jgi:hypothetical protein
MQRGSVKRGGPAAATGMLWAERWNKFGKNLSKSTKGWAAGFAKKFGQRRFLCLQTLREHPELAAPPPYMRDDTEIWLGGGGVEMSLTQGSFGGWQERISSLWTGALGHVGAGEEINTKLTSHESVVIGGVMFRYSFLFCSFCAWRC